MELFVVPPSHIDIAWADGAEKLSKATSRAAREITPSQLKFLLARGERTLVGVREPGCPPLGWAVVTPNQLPNLRVLYVWCIYAPGATGPEAFRLLAEYAKANGCSSIRGSCDDSVGRLWQRRFNARKVYTVFEIEVNQ
jgi:hypothetical protein